MYRIYTTDAFVLECEPAAEASRRITLFTEELGLLRAHAQGVRLLPSKLRAGLQTLHQSSVSLVRGREVWRVTSAVAHSTKSLPSEARGTWARVLAFVERLVRGEEQDGELYRILAGTSSLLQEENFSEKELRLCEAVTIVRMLDHLGYVGQRESKFITLVRTVPNKSTLAALNGQEHLLQNIIAESLAATQL